MARRRRPSPPRDPHYWVQVRSRLWCALGGHDVGAGRWLRYRRDDHRGLGSCEDCLRPVGVYRMPRPFTSSLPDTAPDVRARQTGDDD